MVEQMSLYGSGVRAARAAEDWSDLVASLSRATAFWADLDGMHRAPLPARCQSARRICGSGKPDASGAFGSTGNSGSPVCSPSLH